MFVMVSTLLLCILIKTHLVAKLPKLMLAFLGRILLIHHNSNNVIYNINVSVNNGLVLMGTARVNLQSHNGLQMIVGDLIDPDAQR